MKYSSKNMKEKIDNYNFNFKKKFGQNFITDENTIDRIIELSNIDENITVIEIGPGAGSLTYKLAKKAKKVICFEIDNSIKELLEDNLKELSNVKIYYEDFLKANVLDKINKNDKIYIIANLPYYITTPIIMKVIEDKLPITKMVIMVQKEVGDRFKAKPNSKDYSSLSIYLNYYFDIKKIMDVSRNVFMPKPNVDSIVLEFNQKEKKIKVKNEKLFFNIVRDSFKQKRKTIKNNLKNYDLNKIEEILKKYNLDLNVRAEKIPDYIFAYIADRIGE